MELREKTNRKNRTSSLILAASLDDAALMVLKSLASDEMKRETVANFIRSVISSETVDDMLLFCRQEACSPLS